MISCPNKSSKEWKSLSAELGEDRALLAYFRNGDSIPDVTKARELITNRGLLESFQKLPKLSEDVIFDTLKTNDLVVGESFEEDGKIYYQLNPFLENIGVKLGEVTKTYGAVLQYKGDYVTIDNVALGNWNMLVSAQGTAQKSLTQLSKDFLTSVGVGLSVQDDVIKTYGSNGIADFAERMVRIQSGKIDEAIPEEALHFFLEMLPQDHPALVEALDKIRNSQVYKDTLAKYKNNPNYRTKNGEIRFDKIRKEALAKKMATGLKQKEAKGWLATIIDAVINWIKGLKIQKDPVDILEEMFLSKEIALLNTNLESSEMYNQLADDEKKFYAAQPMNESQKQTLEKIVSYVAATEFDEKEHKFTHASNVGDTVIKGVTSILGSDFDNKLEDPDVIAEILTIADADSAYSDLVDPSDTKLNNAKKLIDYIIKKMTEEPEKGKEKLTREVLEAFFIGKSSKKVIDLLEQAIENRAKTVFGTAVHKLAEMAILGKQIDLDSTDPTFRATLDALYHFMDRKALEKILYGSVYEKGLVDIIRDLRAKGSVIMSELAISNGKLGGVIDIIAIDENGVAEIYDFKTKYIREKKNSKKDLGEEFKAVINIKSNIGVKDEPGVLKALRNIPRSLIEKYSQQQSIYKKLLMEAGVPVGKINIIGVPYRLNEDNKISEIRPVVLENIKFDEKLADYYFSDIDTALNASAEKKAEVLEENKAVEAIAGIQKEPLKESFAKALARLSEISRKFSQNKSMDELYQMLNNIESKTNKLDVQRSRVASTLANFDEVKNFVDVQNNFLTLIDDSAPIIEIAINYFNTLKSKTSTDKQGASQKLNEMMKVKEFLAGYRNMFEELLGYLDDAPTDNPVKTRLTEMIGLVTGVNNQYLKVITPIITQLIGDVFTKESLDTITRTYNELIAAARTRKDVKREKELISERDELPSEKVIGEILKGNKGDAGWLMSKLMATISNNDMVIAGLAKKLKATLDRVRLQNKSLRDNLSNELNKRFDVYGRGLDIKKQNESLTYVAEEFNLRKGTTMNVLYFKTEFDEKLYADHARLVYAIDQAESDETPDKEKIAKAKKDLRDFEREYMQTGFTEEYYRLTKPLDLKVRYQNKDLTVREIESELRGRLTVLENQYTDDDKKNGSLNNEYLKELQAINEEKAALREKFDEYGNPKTGDALKIAEALEEYDKNKKLLYEFVEQTEYYERAKEKAKLEYGADSELFKQWVAKNTRLVIDPKYFEERAALIKERGELNNNMFDSEEISNLYKQLQNLTKGYYDKDGFTKGSMISDETGAKIKDIQEKIDELRKKMNYSIYNAYTREEKAKLDELYYAKNNGLPYSQRELDDLINENEERMKEKIAADPDLGEKIERLKEINEILFSMSKQENTKYYEEELAKQQEIFAQSLNISVKNLMEEGDYLERFKQSDWYVNNHIVRTKVLYSDPETGEEKKAVSETPTAQWRRNIPDDKYILEKPGNHFTRSILKDSYVNDKGETIMLRDPDNLDLKNRLKPKTNEVYRKEHGGKDHPYLNKEFADLKRKNESGVASAKEKVDYENLLYIHSQMTENQKRLAPSERLGFAVPFLEKTMFERTIETGGSNIKEGAQSKVSTLWSGIQRAFTRTDQDVDQNGIPTGEEAVANDSARLATMDNNEIKHVPVRFSTKGEASEASYNVFGGLLSYLSSINRKVELEKELAFVNGLEELLGDRLNQPKSENKNMVLNNIYKKYIPGLEAFTNKGTNVRLDTIKSFVNSVLYNEEYFQGYDMFGINTQKAISTVSGLISFTTLGASPMSWAVNWISGNVQNIVEGAGGKNYTFKEFSAAHADIYGGGKYGSAINDIKDDYVKGKVGNLSFWGQITEVFDPIQGTTDDELGHKVNFNHFKNIFHAGMYAGKIWGEWEIQMKSFVAFIKNFKVAEDGKIIGKEDYITKKVGVNVDSLTLDEISKLKLDALKEWDKLQVNLLDILELGKDGILKVKDQYKDAFEFGSQQFSDIVAKLHAMQKRLNGSYAKIDKSYAEKTSLGRMMFFFKKYLIPLGMNRWGTRRTDYESMTPEQGFYLTFLQTVGKDLAKFRFNVIKNWSTYSDDEKAAIKKTLADVAILLSIWAAYGLLLGFDPDDKDRFKKLQEKGWAAQAAVFVLLKVRSETEQFMPGPNLQEIKGIYTNPSLIFTQTSQLMNIGKLLTFQTLDLLGADYSSNLYYAKDVDESGLKDEGDSKLWAQIVKTTTGYTGRTRHPIDAIKSFEYYQRGK